MATHSFWRGYLKLSLVTCPVAMTPAITAEEKISFHVLNRATGNRVVGQYVDADSGKPVEDDALVRGYETAPDEFVVLEDAEIEAVALESTRTMDIETFVPADSIDWIWYDRPHYLTPDDKVGEEAFAVIRDAMADTGTAAISRLVLYRRERAVMLVPRDQGIIAWTLRYGDEVRARPANAIAGDEKPDRKTLDMVRKLIDQRTQKWNASLLRDPVQERLKDIIAARRKGAKPVKRAEPAQLADNVVDITDALRRSLAAGKRKGV